MRHTALLPLVSSFTLTALAQIPGQTTVNATVNQGRFGNATYDYVIVGGGTSGLAIAARLAEDPSLSVAVIEAGGYYELDGTVASIIPGLAAGANVGTDATEYSTVDWNFQAQPLTVSNLQEMRPRLG
jgi:choline dehydrogenase